MFQTTDLADSLTLAELRRALEAGGYDEAGVTEVLETPEVPGSLRPGDVAFYDARLDGGPRAGLIRLFLLGRPLSPAGAGAALSPALVERLVEAGLLEREDDALRSVLRITPYEGLVFAHDPDDPTALGADHVTGVNPSSRTLASLTVRLPVETALDVGTGCGVQAVLAARHASQVIATDVNPRALWFSALNARLNAGAAVESREGSLFEPVEGELFDLVVSNPPFVISPDADYVFRDSGLPGDEVSRTVVASAAGALRDGGFASVLCNWVAEPGGASADAPRGWAKDSGCDLLLLHYGTEDPLDYAAKWNEPLRLADPAAYAAALERWRDHYRRAGIGALSTGAVILRRRSGADNWARVIEMPLAPTGACGEHINRIFAAQDFLTGLRDDRVLLIEVLRPATGVRLDQSLSLQGREWSVDAVLLQLDEGLGFPGPVQPQEVTHVLLGLDGRRALGDVIEKTAQVHGLDRDALAAHTVATVRELLGLGFLERLR